MGTHNITTGTIMQKSQGHSANALKSYVISHWAYGVDLDKYTHIFSHENKVKNQRHSSILYN